MLYRYGGLRTKASGVEAAERPARSFTRVRDRGQASAYLLGYIRDEAVSLDDITKVAGRIEHMA